MSYPYIIWTMQRSGGTAVADLLGAFSEHQSIQHEPFNLERRFGQLTRAWLEQFDRADLERGVMEALQDRPVIKHCYELVPSAVNAALLNVARLLGYRHVLLERESEVDRVLSLQLARITGAWGKEEAKRAYDLILSGEDRLDAIDVSEAKKHLHHCLERKDRLRKVMAHDPSAFFALSFAEVFSDSSEGSRQIDGVLNFLGITPKSTSTVQQKVDLMRAHSGQNSAQILPHVPNIKEARAALGAL